MAAIYATNDLALEEIQPASPPENNGLGQDGSIQPTAEATEAAEASAPRSKRRIHAIMLALSLSLFVAALDITIVATAIPTIAAYFHSASGYTWIGSAYLLATAAAGPIWAKLSDIWGRKPVLLATVAMFFISSLICAVSTSMGMLIAGRALQGTASGGIAGLVMIVVCDLFSIRQRSLVIGSMEFVWALAAGIGPVLGGVFTQLVSWRWIFYINLPFSGLAFLVLLFLLDVHNPKTKAMDGLKAIDWFGSIAILGVTLMLLLGLDFGGAIFPWNSPTVMCLVVFGLLMSVFFYYSEAKLAKYPLVPLGLFRKRSNVASLMVCFVHGFVFVSSEYYLPLYFQSVREASPLVSGLLVLPVAVTQGLVGIIAGAIIHRTGRYLELIWLGTTIMTIGFGLYIHLSAYSSLGEIIAVQIVAGIGAGLLFEPPLIALQSLVSQSDTASATATFNFIQRTATSLSIVIGGVVFQNGMQNRAPHLVAAGLPLNVTDLLSGTEAAANVMLIATLTSSPQKAAVKEAFAWSLRNMWIMYTCVGACAILMTAFISKQSLSHEHVETITGLRSEKPLELVSRPEPQHQQQQSQD